MHLDVVDLQRFYYRSPLGRLAKSVIRAEMRVLWPDLQGATLVGFGFTAPFLRPLGRDARRVLCLMPGQQGVLRWPSRAPNLSVLVGETTWPLPAGSVTHLLVAHGLETSERPLSLMNEIHRILAPEGEVAFIVPSRTGLWARREATPFGHGRPYSPGQLDMLLSDARFLPERHGAALYFPPSHRKFWLRTARFWQQTGRRFGLPFPAGVHIVTARKRVYSARDGGVGERVRARLDVLEGLTAPRPGAVGAKKAPQR